MSRSRISSLVLLVLGAACLVAGFWVLVNVGAALLCAGALLIAAEWLVPDR